MGILRVDAGDIGAMIVPLGLIGLGIWLIARNRRKGTPPGPEQVHSTFDSHSATPPPPPPHSAQAETGAESGSQNYFAGPGRGPSQESAEFSQQEAPRSQPHPAQQPGYNGGGKLKYDKFFGDMFIDCNGMDLQNVEASVFIGDIEIKLHGGVLAPGLNRMIISGFIGDVRILVPPDMAVFAQTSNFIGDSDLMGRRSTGFGTTLDAQTPNYGTAEKKLYIASNFFIGDIKVFVV